MLTNSSKRKDCFEKKRREEMKIEPITELFKAMEEVGITDEKIKKRLKLAYQQGNFEEMLKILKDYFKLLAERKSLFLSLNQNLNWLVETGQNSSEAATCEFLISPVLKKVMKGSYNPLNVRFPSRANNEPIRADYILKRKVLVEAKRLKDNIKNELSFKDSGENAGGSHLSQAVHYFVKIKYENEEENRISSLRHIVVTNGRDWFVVENADEKIPVQKVKDLPEINGQTLEGKFFRITEWSSYTKLLKKLEELIGK